jgi:hypothetical protein
MAGGWPDDDDGGAADDATHTARPHRRRCRDGGRAPRAPHPPPTRPCSEGMAGITSRALGVDAPLSHALLFGGAARAGSLAAASDKAFRLAATTFSAALALDRDADD